MKNHRVDAKRWKSFSDAFTRSHEGWSASLEVCHPGRPARVEVDDSPFRGATLEERDGRERLILTFGEEPEEHFAYVVREPRTLLTAERDDRTEASLIIEESDDSRCILLLLNPLREENFVDA